MLGLLFLTFLTASLVSSETLTSCTAQWQCSSVSTHYNFVGCSSGVCTCLTQNGFTGNATSSFPCQCAPPSALYWKSNSPFCIRYEDAVAWKLDKAQEAHQNGVVSSIYQDLIWPKPAIIMANLIAGIPTDLGTKIAPDMQGRVDPLGTFSSQDGIVEYFYGATWTGAVKCFNTTFIYLFSRDSMTYMAVNIEITVYDESQSSILFGYVLRQSGTFRFNSQGLVESMDLIIHNLGPNSNHLSPPGSQSQIDMYCHLLLEVAHCNSTNDPTGYYHSNAECHQYFNSYRWGSWDDIYFNGNTSICRFYHALLAIGRPSIHCPHAGRDGGGVCIDHEYTTYFDTNF